jgi:hypothetical protein
MIGKAECLFWKLVVPFKHNCYLAPTLAPGDWRRMVPVTLYDGLNVDILTDA